MKMYISLRTQTFLKIYFTWICKTPWVRHNLGNRWRTTKGAMKGKILHVDNPVNIESSCQCQPLDRIM